MTSVYEAWAAILGDDPDKQVEPTPIVHTSECDDRFAAWKVEHAAYLERWPNVCQECGGQGGFEYQDDPGDRDCSLSGGTTTFSEPCSECLENGTCPRCGKEAWPDSEMFDADELTCSYCGWADSAPDGLPEVPECLCWEKDLP